MNLRHMSCICVFNASFLAELLGTEWAETKRILCCTTKCIFFRLAILNWFANFWILINCLRRALVWALTLYPFFYPFRSLSLSLSFIHSPIFKLSLSLSGCFKQISSQSRGEFPILFDGCICNNTKIMI